MSAATSPGTAYGLQRVCAAWGFARSSFYAMREQATAERRKAPGTEALDHEALLVAKADLEASPWRGTPARSGLGFGSVVASARKRVLRVKCSPHQTCR